MDEINGTEDSGRGYADEIVSMIKFKGVVIVATKRGVFKLVDDKFEKIEFKEALDE